MKKCSCLHQTFVAQETLTEQGQTFCDFRVLEGFTPPPPTLMYTPGSGADAPTTYYFDKLPFPDPLSMLGLS
jgi:hypothetical protein